MSFASPWLLAGLALLLPVLVAFLVRRRREVVRVPSTLLWRKVAVSRARNRRLRHLTRILALLACLAAVAALILAAARPVGARTGEHVVLVVDVSASMGEGEGDGPLAQAKAEAHRILALRGASDRYAVVAAGSAPTRLAGPTDSAVLLERAVDALRPETGMADLGAALELAAELLRGRPGGRVLLLTDGGVAAGEAPRIDDGLPLGVRRFAHAAPHNLGLSTFAARPPADATTDDERELLVAVSTSSPVTRAARVELTVDGVTLDRAEVQVEPGREAELRLRVQVSTGRLEVRVSPADGLSDALPGDDGASLVLTRPVPPRALLLAPGEAEGADVFFVEQALRAAGVREVEIIAPARASEALGPDDLVVALGESAPRRLDAPTLYVATREGSMPFDDSRLLDTPEATRLLSVAEGHPLLRGVTLDGVTIEEARAVEVTERGRALVELDGGTIVATGGAGRGSWVYLGVEPLRSDLVLRVAFPVLVANALSVLGGSSEVAVAQTVPRAEVELRPQEEPLGLHEALSPSWSLPLAPAPLLALLAALLLLGELVAFRRGWAS